MLKNSKSTIGYCCYCCFCRGWSRRLCSLSRYNVLICGLCQLLTPKTHTHTDTACLFLWTYSIFPWSSRLLCLPVVEGRRRPWRSSRILSPSRCRCRCRCPSSSSRCSCRPPAAPRRRRSTRRCTRSRTSRCGCTATPSGCPPPPRTSLPSTSPPSSASTGPYVARPPGPGSVRPISN
jgi:hypothetical protein